MVAITPDVITQYVARRQAEPNKYERLPSNRTINMELVVLKRMLRPGLKYGKVLRVPPIEFLKEAPAREGFFKTGPVHGGSAPAGSRPARRRDDCLHLRLADPLRGPDA